MFTGLVEATGVLARRDGGHLRIACPFAAELSGGESVNVSGACLTVESHDASAFTVTAVPATLSRTTIGALQVGGRVNLERAMRADGRFGGHIVQGHVDGVGEVVGRRDAAEGFEVQIAAPPEVDRYIVPRGSVAVDGVSLTIAAAGPGNFTVAIIPHTAAHTTIGTLRAGHRVNLEADILAKYVESLCARGGARDGRG